MLGKKDELILIMLKENSNLTVKQIAKKVRLPITTAHNRIKKLRSSGVIKKYTIITDNKKLGKLITAYVLVNMDYQTLKESGLTHSDVAKKLEALGAEEAKVITGSKDILFKIYSEDMIELSNFLYKFAHSIPGVTQTETYVAID